MYDSSVKVLESAADAFIAAGFHLAKLHLLHSYHLGTICILSQMQIAGLQSHFTEGPKIVNDAFL